MRVLVTGATGMIGRELVARLAGRGDEVFALSRDLGKAMKALPAEVVVSEWPDPSGAPPDLSHLPGCDAVFNLMGEPLAQRWSANVKSAIRRSRGAGTRHLVAALSALPLGHRPSVLVSQSATGFYGASDDRPLDESGPAGADFLADVVVDWEAAALTAESFCRVVCTRTGVVLSESGGAMAKLLPFFRAGVGGRVGGGGQYFSWIHLDDEIAALLFVAENDSIAGVINVTAPNPCTNAELTRSLGRVLRRPAIVPVPPFALRVLYGEMADTVLTGARVVPARLEAAGYRFSHPELEPALRNLLAK